MKKIAAGFLACFLLFSGFMKGGALAADTGSQGEESGTSVSWPYPVPLTALYAPYGRLVNRDHLLEESFAPQNLMEMEVKRATDSAVELERTAGMALESMFEAASEAGYTLYLKSGYRNYRTQKTMYQNRLESIGKDDGVVAFPGASEHQTGLACDILNRDYANRPRMTTDFSETDEAKWLKENCAAFGFVLRYPEDKREITQTIFEPWHFRYVGVEVAEYVMAQGITLEEFWDEWESEVAAFEESGGDVQAWMEYEKQLAQKELQPESNLLELYGEDGDQEVSLTF